MTLGCYGLVQVVLLPVAVLALAVSGRPEGWTGLVPLGSNKGVNFKPFPGVHLRQETIGDDFLSSVAARPKRDPVHQVDDCIYTTLEEGEFYSKAGTRRVGETCGIYINADPDQLIEIKFNYFDVPCENGGLVVVVDGWELSGEVFPSPEDHPKDLKSRLNEYCGRRKIKQAFMSSQNAALIQYRMPSRTASFSFSVRFVKNPTPCNILLQPDETYTLRNYDKRSNCSVSALVPAAVNILNINVGVTPSRNRGLEFETGTIYKCQKRGLDDYVQIGGSNGLDNSNMQIADTLCGLSSKPGSHVEYIGCGTTSVRLVSSGGYDNSITVHLKKLTENDINSYMSVVCIPDDIELEEK
ncbi:corticotropin-releasing factor-binding protein isoform X2 [Sitophilus oryzae]|uniref:Corticotropin-releasing factor-binding protein n=1 Tax=Sitophilus oryzae TaxID=7048 RepID=A0A6J2YIA3_SITOR|nr:corticotropin-releasing factor-binding protein isoform X2 [Sitophilus oryzae]